MYDYFQCHQQYAQVHTSSILTRSILFIVHSSQNHWVNSCINYCIYSWYQWQIHTRMICQRSPSTRCGFPACKSSGPMLTILQPIACDDVSASVRFSCIWYTLNLPLLMARSSIVPGCERFTNLLLTSTAALTSNIFYHFQGIATKKIKKSLFIPSPVSFKCHAHTDPHITCHITDIYCIRKKYAV